MTWWRRLRQRRRAEEQLDKELRFHLEQHASDLVARGVEPGEARRQAALALGGLEQVKEECRDARGTRWLEDIAQDLRYAARTLGRSAGFTIVAVVTLALGIGASTAIFSAVNPILFESLPYPQADRLMMLWDFKPDGGRADVTFGTYRELAERSRAFAALAVTRPWQPTMTSTAEPERFDGQRVTASYCRVLGVSPALGRDFEEADELPNSPPVAIISDGLWRRRFGGDRAIVGRQVTLDDVSVTVVGVMPRAFENVLAPSAEIWAPLRYDRALPLDGREWGHHLRMVGRLEPGVGIDQARRELDAIARAPVPEFSRPPWASLGQGLLVRSLQDDVTSAVRPALLAIFGAVMLVLLIACVNVTNLLLARGAQRRGEFAVRAALGAGRRRLIRQLLTESLLLAAVAGAFGIATAEAGVRALVALGPPELPRLDAIRVDGSALAFAIAVTTLIGLVVGLVPALQVSRGDLQTGLQESSRRTAGGHHLARRALVVAGVAFAFVLLVSAGLLLRSLQQLFAVDPGFRAEHVIAMQVQTSGRRFDDDSTTRLFFDEALEAVRRVPGVASAAFTSQLPLSGDPEMYGVHFESNPAPDEDQSAFRYAVTPGYLETMGIPLVHGRTLDERDAANAPVAVLINESFAKRKFPGQDPIGQRLRIGPNEGPWDTVVGVVADVKQTSLAMGHADQVYITAAQSPFAYGAQWLVVRARGDEASLAPAVREAIWSVDKDQPIVRIATMDEMLAASAAERRFALVLFEVFAAVALALAAIGIYGVLSGGVAERVREIGVRLALGATRGQVLALIVRQGMTLTGLGVAVGAVGAAAASRVIVTLLFGVSRLDPLTYLGVIALLAGVAGVACWVPAWRAARVDPSITLRAE
jgi:putative ABC transport system permease protein